MATYVYNCRTCQVFIEVVRSMHDIEILPACESCGELMKRVYSPAPVKFNAPGFYTTGG